jgi:hypothetical protein
MYSCALLLYFFNIPVVVLCFADQCVVALALRSPCQFELLIGGIDCRQAKAAGAKYRLGPELEISGYGCEVG